MSEPRAAVGRAAIGVDIGGTFTKGGIVQADGTLLLRTERPTDPTAGTKGAIAVVEDLLARAGEFEVRPEAVGVGAAGFVDADRGAIFFSPNVTYDDPHIKAALSNRVDLPVVVDNDANAAAWGERAFGTARGSDHVALVTLGTGIGSGFIVAGRILRGLTGSAAEFGHTVVEIDGPQCTCGLKGCLEQFASGTAIARMAADAVVDDRTSSIAAFADPSGEITAEHVAKAARQYDETARAVLRRAGRALGIGLSNIVNVFDPEIIVLAGSVIGAGEPFLGPARDQLASMTLTQGRRPMRLDASTLGKDIGIVGAAALALDASPPT